MAPIKVGTCTYIRRFLSNNLIALLCPLGVLIFSNSWSQSQFRFEHLHKTDGLANDFVDDAVQDGLGYLWFRWAGAITRYDGYNFKVYTYNPHDSSTFDLNFNLGPPLLDYNKNLWLLEHLPGNITAEKFICARYDVYQDKFVKYEIDIGGSSVRGLEFERGGSVVWIATGDNVLYSYNFQSGKGEKFQGISTQGNPSNPYLITSLRDNGKTLIVATNKGLWFFDKESKKFTRPRCSPGDTTTLYGTWMKFLTHPPHNDKRSWLRTANKCLVLDSALNIVEEILLPNINFATMAIDSDGIFWFASAWAAREGLFRFDPHDRSLVQLKHDPGNPHSLTTDDIGDVMIDSEQNVWVCSNRGVNVLKRKDINFYNTRIEGGTVWANAIFSTGNKEYLIVNALSDYVNNILFSPIPEGKPDSIRFRPLLPPLDLALIISAKQGKRHLWFATLGSGVLGYPILDNNKMLKLGRPFIYDYDQHNINTLAGSSVHTVWEDPFENLWVLLQNQKLDLVRSGYPFGSDKSVQHYNFSGIVGGSFHAIDEKSFFNLKAYELNIVHLPLDAKGEYRFENVYKSKELLSYVHKSSDGTLFIGTFTQLLSARKLGGHYEVDPNPVIDNLEVDGILEDHSGRLWIYGGNQLVCYDRSTRTSTFFDERDGFDHNRAIEQGWFHKTSKGTFIAVSPDGVSLFNPNEFRISNRNVNPVITKLEINNKGVKAGRAMDNINVMKELALDYKENNFSLEFAAMEMTAPKKNLYRHMLEGYDADWIESDYKDRTATYTNLDAGTYTFRIKASNHHGVWSDNERTLKVIILPPPWKTAWAYSGYALIVLGLLFMARRMIVQRERLKGSLKLAKLEQEKEHFELEKAKEVDRLKTSFFTNISHEFRTPLTLIKGPVATLLDRFKDDPDVAQRLKLVQRNSDVLLRLINQLLDLAKLESGTMKIEKSSSDINSFIRSIAGSFESLARHKNVTLSVEISSDSQQVVFDKDKLETILINLINNAIKFTPAGGSVVVRKEFKNLQANNETNSVGTPLWRRGVGGEVKITVRDTGIGIPIEHQHKIFERFHQVSEAHKEIGTGIGLSLVKELIELLEGTITVSSEPGKGTTFTVIIPVEAGTETFETADALVQPLTKSNGHSDNEFHAQSSHNGAPELPHVLVVEDNDDLRAFIIDSLGREFYFLEADNGRKGLDVATSDIPDLIISDVMMPEMDGITMAGKIKTDHRSSHIPLILLTAKSTEDSKLQGLKSGADDYLTKPFNREELLLKVRNSISRQIKLREKLRAEVMSSAPGVEVMSEDERFLIRVKEKVLERLSDEQLSVESLADDIGISRVHLYRKVSGLTGLSVNELIRKLRLQRAAQLIGQHWGPISQVAYEVGYSNLSYFSKVFKEEFGMLPSEYMVKTE